MLSYDDMMMDAGADGRQREAELLFRSAELMRRADAPGAGPRAVLDAALFAERLWSRLIEDLGSPLNALDASLRADLISIGLFVMRSADAARRGEGGFAAASEITDTLRRGLAA